MLPGITLKELLRKLTEQNKMKRDYLAEATDIRFVDRDEMENGEAEGRAYNQLTIKGLDNTAFDINGNCHRQIASRLDIPWKYYDRMAKELPELLQDNVNHWLRASEDRRMVRTLDGTARAFLSDRYKLLDHIDLAEAVLPTLYDVRDMEIVSCEVTEDRMYIKALFPRMKAEITVGDVVQSGIVISNSEVGNGALKVEHLIYRLSCTNGMISTDNSTCRNHVGRNVESQFGEMYREETLKQDDKAFWMKIQDTVKGFATNADYFNSMVELMREATEQPVYGKPFKAVELLSNKLSLTENERYEVINHLLTEGDLSKYGMANAVTRTAQDSKGYNRATELETLGSRVINLSSNEWQEIATAGIDN